MFFKELLERVLNEVDILFDDSRKRIDSFLSTRTPQTGISLTSWPKFYDYFEDLKSTSTLIDHLFLDYDIVHIPPAEKALHPLTPSRGFNQIGTDKKIIAQYRKEKNISSPNEMTDYHPSGLGAVNYLIDNRNIFNEKINQIVVHCTSPNNASIMIDMLVNQGGYKDVQRGVVRELNQNGYKV